MPLLLPLIGYAWKLLIGGVQYCARRWSAVRLLWRSGLLLRALAGPRPPPAAPPDAPPAAEPAIVVEAADGERAAVDGPAELAVIGELNADAEKPWAHAWMAYECGRRRWLARLPRDRFAEAVEASGELERWSASRQRKMAGGTEAVLRAEWHELDGDSRSDVTELCRLRAGHASDFHRSVGSSGRLHYDVARDGWDGDHPGRLIVSTLSGATRIYEYRRTPAAAAAAAAADRA
jgi:hypothetical protein